MYEGNLFNIEDQNITIETTSNLNDLDSLKKGVLLKHFFEYTVNMGFSK